MPLSSIPNIVIYSNENDDIVQSLTLGTTVTDSVSGWIFDPMQFCINDVRTLDVTSAVITANVTVTGEQTVKLVADKSQTTDIIADNISTANYYGDLTGEDLEGYTRTLAKIRLVMQRRWRVA